MQSSLLRRCVEFLLFSKPTPQEAADNLTASMVPDLELLCGLCNLALIQIA
jgi:hypothetical protein